MEQNSHLLWLLRIFGISIGMQVKQHKFDISDIFKHLKQNKSYLYGTTT